MTNAATVGASKRREAIPHEELMALEEMTTEELAWRGDHHENAERRAWARWELEHREALGSYVDVSPAGRLRRSQATAEFVDQLERERKARDQDQAAGRHRLAFTARLRQHELVAKEEASKELARKASPEL